MANYVQRLLARAAGRPPEMALRPVVSALPWRKGAEPPITDLVEEVPGSATPLPAPTPRATPRPPSAPTVEDWRSASSAASAYPSQPLPSPAPAPPWRTPSRTGAAEARRDEADDGQVVTRVRPADLARPSVATSDEREEQRRSAGDGGHRGRGVLQQQFEALPQSASELLPRPPQSTTGAAAATDGRRDVGRAESTGREPTSLQPRRADPAAAPATPRVAPVASPPPSRREARAAAPAMGAPESRRNAPPAPPAPRLVIGRLTVEVAAPPQANLAAPRRAVAAAATPAAPASPGPGSRSSYRFGLGQV